MEQSARVNLGHLVHGVKEMRDCHKKAAHNSEHQVQRQIGHQPGSMA